MMSVMAGTESLSVEDWRGPLRNLLVIPDSRGLDQLKRAQDRPQTAPKTVTQDPGDQFRCTWRLSSRIHTGAPGARTSLAEPCEARTMNHVLHGRHRMDE